MSIVEGTRFHQLLSTLRPAENGHSDSTPAQLFAAVTAAHAELSHATGDAGVFVGAWERPAGSARLRVLFGGRPVFPPAGRHAWNPGETSALLYPPGSIATAVDTAEVIESWEQIPVWLRCTGQSDPLWNAAQGQPESTLRGGFDDYVVHLRDSFVWLVIAEPVSAEAIDKELTALEIHIPVLRRHENSENGRVALERAQARFRELSKASTSGLWNIHILVGATDQSAARQAAALLCSASDLTDLPYVLTPDRITGSFSDVLARVSAGGDGPQSPFLAAPELLIALARPPKRELPGVRLVDRPDFDLTQETTGTVLIGRVLDESAQEIDDFRVDTNTLNRHVFVTGATGSGKSQTVRHVLQQLHHAHIPWLVIEPAKAEYAAMAGRIGGDNVVIIHPGSPSDIPVGLNPLEPEPGFPLQTHIDLVRALFLAAFEAEEPFPQVLSHALSRCYQDFGWDPALSAPVLPGTTPKYPQLGDLRKSAFGVINGIGYGKEVADNVRGFVDVRISSLRLGTPGRFFEGGYPLDVEKLIRRNVVLEIEDLGDDQDKAFFIGAILIRIHEHLRVQHASGNNAPGLHRMLVVEEAHRLLKRVQPGSPAAHAVELFASMLAEIRAYGTGILIAEQIPEKILTDVIKNTALKIVHRLPAEDDRTAVGSTMNLNDNQSQHVVSLPPGRAVVFADRMDRPLRISVPLGEDQEKTEDISRKLAVDCINFASPSVIPLDNPLTLRDINKAIRLAETPRMVLWMELLTIAHIVGKPEPSPDISWLDEIRDSNDPHLVEYAIAYRATEAISDRYQGLIPWYHPEELAQHLIDCATHRLRGLPSACQGTEIRWQAGRYRWVDVMRSLYDDTPKDQQHPDTALWAERGLRLPQPTQTEQLAALRLHPDLWLPPRNTVSGVDQPPAFEKAVNQLSNAQHLAQRFAEATAFLNIPEPWPLLVLNIEQPPEPDTPAEV